MKKWFVVLCCLFFALSTAWGATLLSEGFDGMENRSLPTDWTCSLTPANIEYYTSTTYSDDPPSFKLTTDGMTLTSPTFATGATNVSFLSYTAASGVGNQIKVEGFVSVDEDWVEIGTATCTEKGKQTYDLPVENSDITCIRFTFSKAANASLDDILVEGEETVEGITVTFDQTNWFEIVEGTLGASVTATADNGVPPYTYVWNCDQSEAITDVPGATLSIPATLTEGDYSLFVEVRDSDDGELGPQGGNFGIGLRVVKMYEVTVVNGIDAHGTIVVDLAHAKAGDTVTIGSEPDDGYVLESLSATWEGGDLEITDGTFTMPAGAVTVSGTFAVYEGGDLTITFDETTSNNPKSSSESFTSDEIEFNAVECIGGQAGQSGTDADKALRVRHVNGTKGYFANANAFEKPIQQIKFAYKAGSATSTHLNKEWSLETSVDGANWNLVATVTTAEDWQTLDTAELNTAELATAIPANSKFFRVISASTNVSSTARNADFDNIEIWFGEATYHVELSGVENGARVPYDDAVPAVTLSAEAKDGGTEPFTYEWTVNGEPVDGYTGATYEFSAIGEYEVSVVCTDAANVSTEPASVSFSIEQQYIVHSPSGLEGGAITAEPSPAFVGETVTVTATAADGYVLDGELGAVWGEDNTPLELSKSNTFEMPAGDVHLLGQFRPLQDTAALPFEWHGPWKEMLGSLDGVTGTLGTDKSDAHYDQQGNGIAVFGAKSHNFCVKFDGAPETVSYWIHGSGLDTEVPFSFKVQESADGTEWTDVAVYTPETEGLDGYTQVTNALAEESRYVKFFFEERGSKGEIGIDAIVISGEGGDQPEASIVFIGETTATVGGTITLSFALENYEDACTWALEPAEGVGEIDSATGVYTWTPAEAGTATITVSALDETLEVIATTGEILLTVEDVPGPGPEPILVEATLTGPVTVADGKAVFEVSLDNPAAELAADDIWAADDIADASSWKPAEGAEVIPANGGYKVTVPEAAGNFIAIGKPAFLATE